MAPGHPGKRARVVCRRCHEKKIRCDLQVAPDQRRCSGCVEADAVCEFRPSNKGRRLKRQPVNGSMTDRLRTVQQPTPEEPTETQVESYLPNGDSRLSHLDDIPPTLQQSNLETYWEFIYPWCPIIDPGSEASDEPILKHALASLAISVISPLIPHAEPREHYRRARDLFYASGIDAITRIKAALLLSFPGAGPPNVGSMDSALIWLTIAIRLAQEIGLHREPPPGTSKEMVTFRRRIWWTLYARERILAICHGQPCLIDEDYIDIGRPQVEDFPPGFTCYAFLFTRWVSLCETIGFLNKQMFLSRRTGNSLPTHDIAERLTRWLRGLSPALHLPISTDRTTPFDRHVHFLYLPYLATISLVYLNTSQRLPEACAAAVIAAACTARIFEDLLARNCIRFLLGQGDWYIAIAALALRPLRSLDVLSTQAAAQIHLLSLALKQLVPVSHSAKLIDAGLDRLLHSEQFEHTLRTPLHGHDQTSNPARSRPSTLDDLCANDGVPWPEFFPFVTVNTSPLLEKILTECQHSFPELWSGVDLSEFQEFLEGFKQGEEGEGIT